MGWGGATVETGTVTEVPRAGGPSNGRSADVMRRIVRAVIVAVGLAAPPAAAAQGAPIVGTWELEMTVGMRVENGEPTMIRGKGRLEVVEQGDSLVATLAVTPPDGMPARPASRFAAKKVAGNEFAFVQRSEVRMNANGEEHTAVSISNWRFTVTGDALRGTVSREIEGMPMAAMPEQPVSGTRVR